jgi:hypothetical protein
VPIKAVKKSVHYLVGKREGKWHFADEIVVGVFILEKDSTGSEQVPVAGCCENCRPN